MFTALKDESYDGRRLENAALRLHAIQKLGKTPSFQAASQVTQGRCAFNKEAPISAQLDAHLSHTHADLGKAIADSDGHPMLDDSWAAKHLLGVCLKNKLSNDAVGEILQAGASLTYSSCTHNVGILLCNDCNVISRHFKYVHMYELE